jgi:transcriptional regulator with XRE-family HTH domain
MLASVEHPVVASFPMMKVKDVGRFIRDQRKAAQLSLRKLAKLAGVSNPYLSQIERGLRKPSAEILNGIAKALRISAETLYVKAGILDARDEPGPDDLVSGILADRTITERQKQVLIQIYNSFREETERSREARRKRARRRKPEGPGASEAPLPATGPGGRVESAG